MSALQSLAVAVDMATRQRDAARQVLGDAQAGYQAACAQLHQLSGYANETEQRWGVRESAALSPEVFYHHNQFMGRLQHAAALQDTVVQDRNARVVQAQQQLLQAELRLASLKKVMEARALVRARQQAQRDQKQTDERASLALRRQSQYSNDQE